MWLKDTNMANKKIKDDKQVTERKVFKDWKINDKRLKRNLPVT